MPRTTGSKTRPRSVQREIALDALRGARPVDVATEYEVTESTVRRLRDEATRDPEGAVELAREELAFRLEVAEISGE